MGHNERGHGEGTVGGFEATEWAHMEFKRAIKPFNDLFKWPKLGGDFVQVLETDDLFKRDLMIFVTFFVEEHDAGGVGRVSIGDEGKFLVGVSSADGLVHSDGGRHGFAVVRDVVRRDGVFLGRCK